MRQVLSRHLIASMRLTSAVERLVGIRRLHTWRTVTYAVPASRGWRRYLRSLVSTRKCSLDADIGSGPGRGSMATSRTNENIRYEPQESCPPLVSIGVGFQFIVITLTTMAIVTLIILQSADQPESYVSWSFFAALAISGICTVLQAVRIGRFGAAHVLIMGPSPTFISVSIAALSNGGPEMLSGLIVVSSLIQFVVASRLAAMRRVITPVVSGTVFMLIAAVVMPSLFDLMRDTPEGTSSVVAPLAAGATLAAAVLVSLRAPRSWQQWSPVMVIALGWAISAAFGLRNIDGVAEAAWIGIPDTGAWHGFQFAFGADFMAMLPGFVVAAVVSSIIAIGNGVAIQEVSQREPRATDFRVVQGALNGEAICNLLSGLAGTIASTLYPSSVGSVSITGVASRSVGVCAGLILVGVALSPKLLTILLAIPRPVAAAYMVALFSLIFLQGVRSIAQDGFDARKSVIAGVAFWIGVSFDNGWIFPDLLVGTWGTLLGNGLTTGCLAAIAMTLVLGITSRRGGRLSVECDASAFPKVDTLLNEFASKAGWNEASANRLRAAGEEALSSLLSQDDIQGIESRKRLTVSVRGSNGSIELEFMVTSQVAQNIEDRLAYLSDQPEIWDDREISFRLLRHYASSVRHRKYHDIDIVTVRVEGSP